LVTAFCSSTAAAIVALGSLSSLDLDANLDDGSWELGGMRAKFSNKLSPPGVRINARSQSLQDLPGGFSLPRLA
jgi:hypothetical protein